MEKHNANGKEQGSAPVLDKATIEKWLLKDISVAITCLEAIAKDPDMMSMMAEWMLGRLQNQQNAKHQQEVVDANLKFASPRD